MLIEKPRIPLRAVLLYGLWPTFIKVIIYRLKGYRIGKGVSIGFGSIICGESVEVGDYTSIGFLTIIRGKGIRLGAHVKIGSMTFLDTPYVDIGEGTKINEQVFVGGLQFPDSRLTVGHNCSIMQFSFINPAPSIVIGNGCAIGGYCLIFGHSSSLDIFDGYNVEFAPIEIGNNVGLSWRTFILPGTKIGDGSIVGANSVVSGTIPPSCMAVGFPARIVGRPPVFPKALGEVEKVELFQRLVVEMVEYFIKSGLECEKAGGYFEVRQPRGRWRRQARWRMQVIEGEIGTPGKELGSARLDVFVSLASIPIEVRQLLSARKVMWMDIANKACSRVSNPLGEEVLLFFRRYGFRPLRHPRVGD